MLSENDKSKSYFGSALSKAYTALFDDSKPWCVCDKDKFEELFKKLLKLSHKPYISPVLYHNFYSLKDVKLYLVTSDYCPFLDENVKLAKLWKGN